MKKNTKSIFAALVLMMCPLTLSAQGFTTLGVGINSPNGTLHVHTATEVDPILPPTPDPGGPIRSVDLEDAVYNYQTIFHLSNGLTGTNSNEGFSIKQYNRHVLFLQHEASTVEFTMPSNHIIFTPSGRIGIGDTVEGWQLNVGKTTRFGTSVMMTNSLSVGHNIYVSGMQTIADSLTIGGALRAGNGFYCDTAGNMKVKHLRVTLEDWPDYVFGEGYRLRPLAEVEAYIGQHGHLPEVPAAAEVEKEGVDQGELNKVLMQKVEELTLYIIDLQKQIEELKNK